MEDQYRLISLNEDEVLDWLRQRRIIKREGDFKCCGQEMALQKDSSKADGQRFRCNTCRRTVGIRENSVFEGTKLPLNAIFRLLFVGWPLKESRERLSDYLGIAKFTVTK